MARRLTCAVLLAASLGAAPALAQEPAPTPTAAQKETARSAMDEGDKAMKEGNFEKALKAYQLADKLVRVPTTGLARGQAMVKLGKLVEARDVLLRVSRRPVRDGEPKVFATAREDAAKLAQDLLPRIPALTINVKGAKAGTPIKVSVDGAALPSEALGFAQKVSPGEHEVKIEAAGYKTHTEKVKLAEAEKKALDVTLEVDPDAAKKPAEPVPAPAPGPASPAPAPAPASDGGGGVPWWSFVGFGVGGAGLIMGGVTGGIALSKKGKLEDSCNAGLCGREDQAEIDSMKTLSHLSTAGFVIGAAGAAVGVVGIIVGSGSDEPEKTGLQPLVGPGYVGLRGSF